MGFPMRESCMFFLCFFERFSKMSSAWSYSRLNASIFPDMTSRRILSLMVVEIFFVSL